MRTPPLSLYVHFPWCVRKCPVLRLQFASGKGPDPRSRLSRAAAAAISTAISTRRGRPIDTVFIGGGTPSLLSGRTIAALLDGIARARRRRRRRRSDAGGQSRRHRRDQFRRLPRRRHQSAVDRRPVIRRGAPEDARPNPRSARHEARSRGRDGRRIRTLQPRSDARSAEARPSTKPLPILSRALALGASHISWYQLTIEPKTEFALRPPPLPDEDTLGDIEAQASHCLERAGLERYEVSAFARPGQEARHNLNYWTFGDYLGIGAGAHGKITCRSPIRSDPHQQTAGARTLPRNASGASCGREAAIADDALPAEFLLNALRLIDGVPRTLVARTHRASTRQRSRPLGGRQQALGLMRAIGWRVTPLGLRYLDTVVSEFL